MINNTGTGPCLEPSFHRARTSTSGQGIYQKGCNHFSFESRISNIYHAPICTLSTVSAQYIYLATISTLLRVAAWPRPALRPRHEAAGGGVAAGGGGAVALLARLCEPVTAHGSLEYL